MLHIWSIFPSAKQNVPFYDSQMLLFAPFYKFPLWYSSMHLGNFFNSHQQNIHYIFISF